jgi:hypothetical protein
MMGAPTALPAISRPTALDPVNEIRRGIGCVAIASPISLLAPITTFSTPAGKPASS